MAMLKEQHDAEAKKREARLEQIRAEIEDTKGARSTFAALALANSPMAWGAPVVSVLVTVGFFSVFCLFLVLRGMARGEQSRRDRRSHRRRLGRSVRYGASVSGSGRRQGSRQKDAATTAAMESQVKQSDVLQSTMLQAQAERLRSPAIHREDSHTAAPASAAPKHSNFRRCMDIVMAYDEGASPKIQMIRPRSQPVRHQDRHLRDWRHDDGLTVRM